MTIRELNRLKAQRPCLKCGKLILTDRCHRLCVKCEHANARLVEPRAALSQDALQWLRSFTRALPGVGN